MGGYMSKIRLSNTKRNKFKECSRRYDFHYNFKYRSKFLGSALFFGVAYDEALNRMLLDKKDELTDSEVKLKSDSPEKVFLKHMSRTFHNGSYVNLRDFYYAQYTKSDFDETMLTEADLGMIGQDLEYCKAHVEWYHEEMKKKKPEVSSEDVKMFNQINWHSLKNKGLLMLQAYKEEVMPQIHKVYSIQERVKLPNEKGDYIEGVIDFTASFVDEPEVVYVVDNKTASKAYKDKDLDESDQLHLYAYYKELKHIAYIVCEKNIRKREPRVRINILKGKVDDDFTDNLLDDYENTLYDIRQEEYTPNFDSGCVFYRKKCEYYDICHHDKFNEDVLIDMKEKK